MASIMIGVDSSDASDRAIELGLQLARGAGVGVLIVHAIPWSPYSFQTNEENSVRAGEREREIAAATEQLLEPALAKAREAGVEAEGLTRHGHPVEILVDLTAERGIDHIVVGRTGESRMKKVLYGGIPGRLILSSPVTVTVVP